MTDASYTLPQFAVGTGAMAGNPEDKTLLMSVEEQAKFVKAALDGFSARNMRPWLDTALHYGAGNALKAIGLGLGEPPQIKDLTLSIKVGRVLVEPTKERPYEKGPFAGEAELNREFDYSAEGVTKAFNQSFEFLNAERKAKGWSEIKPEDLNVVVFVHDPESGVHGEKTTAIQREAITKAIPALNKLKMEGKVKLVGIGTNEIACAEKFADHGSLDLIMLAGRLTLLAHGAGRAPQEIKNDTRGLKKLLRVAKNHHVQVISAAPANSGMMYEGGNWYNYAPASEEVRKWRDNIKDECGSVPLITAALRFPVDIGGAAAVVVGPASEPQLNDSMASFNHPVPASLWKNMADKKLIDLSQFPDRGISLA